jgi:hypothetical protein
MNLGWIHRVYSVGTVGYPGPFFLLFIVAVVTVCQWVCFVHAGVYMRAYTAQE